MGERIKSEQEQESEERKFKIESEKNAFAELWNKKRKISLKFDIDFESFECSKRDR